MKLLLIVAFICVCFEYVSSEQNQEEMNLEEQIQNLQTEVKYIRQYLKEVCFELNSKIFLKHLLIFDHINFGFYSEQMYLKSLPENGRSIKEMYLSSKAKDTLSVKQNDSLVKDVLVKIFKREITTKPIMGLSSQVVEDYLSIFKLFYDDATRHITFYVMMISSKCKIIF